MLTSTASLDGRRAGHGADRLRRAAALADDATHVAGRDPDLELHAAAAVDGLDLDAVGLVDELAHEVLQHGRRRGRGPAVAVDLVGGIAVVVGGIAVVLGGVVVLVVVAVGVLDVVELLDGRRRRSLGGAVSGAAGVSAGASSLGAGWLRAMPSSLRTRSVGWAPLAIQASALATSILTTDGSWRGS